MFDVEATKEALDQRLKRRGFQSLAYRSLLVALIDGEGKVYGVDAAIKRVSALVEDTYREMLDKATAVGFSASFSMTLSDMATRANLDPGGGRDEVYLYLMKSTAKSRLGSLTAAQLDKGDVFEVTDVARATYGFRVYANLTDSGVDQVRAQVAQLARISGVVAYKVAKPGARWRRDTMVVYCETAAATGRVLTWFRGLQAGVADPETYFAADVPYFTKRARGLRGVSSVEDPNAGDEDSYSQRMAHLVRTAIEAGADSVFADEANASIFWYVEVIVARLNEYWVPNVMVGKPKP